MLQFEKFSTNPILVPDKNSWWESGAVFNCAATNHEGKVALLYRAIPGKYEKTEAGLVGEYISYLGLATSEDGINFTRHPEPVMKPDTEFDRYGCEDPRIVKLEGSDEYIITYTALSQDLTKKPNFDECVRIALATTKDFLTYTKLGIMGPPCSDKDAVIFPERINGKIAMLHRIAPDIQIAYFDSVEHMANPGEKYWKDHMDNLEKYTVMKPSDGWESRKLGAGPTPIKTDHGWLMIYHGVDEKFVYRGGAALLDLEDPCKVIAKIPHPILEPTEIFETSGDVPNVVFPEGTAILGEELFVYYGGGDASCCGAKIHFKKFMDYLLTHKV